MVRGGCSRVGGQRDGWDWRGGMEAGGSSCVVASSAPGCAAVWPAARRLAASGHDVTVVEARGRVGGRTEGLVLDDGTPLELGGQWLGEGHTRMYELVGELGRFRHSARGTTRGSYCWTCRAGGRG